MKIMIYGYGNPGRQDDGLGIAFSNAIEEWVKENGLDGYTFDNNYQLNIEDAELISDKDIVIFADASVEDIPEFCVSMVDGTKDVSFTTHAASPGYIVQLCQEIFGKAPPTYLVHIKGYTWEFDEGLSDNATINLKLALDHIKKLLKSPEIFLEQDLGKIKMCGD